jgi:hypothetical protein
LHVSAGGVMMPRQACYRQNNVWGTEKSIDDAKSAPGSHRFLSMEVPSFQLWSQLVLVVSGGLHSVERREKKRLKCDRSRLPPVLWAGLRGRVSNSDVPVALPRKDRLMARLGVRFIVRRED